MTLEQRKELLGSLAKIQQNTAPIVVSIGYVTISNQVAHDVIVLKEAPPVVTEDLVKAGYHLDICPGGVIIDKY